MRQENNETIVPLDVDEISYEKGGVKNKHCTSYLFTIVGKNGTPPTQIFSAAGSYVSGTRMQGHEILLSVSVLIIRSFCIIDFTLLGLHFALSCIGNCTQISAVRCSCCSGRQRADWLYDLTRDVPAVSRPSQEVKANRLSVTM